MRRTIFHKSRQGLMRRRSHGGEGGGRSRPVYILGHVNPSGYDMVERNAKRKKKEELPSRRTEEREGRRTRVRGLPADVREKRVLLIMSTHVHMGA